MLKAGIVETGNSKPRIYKKVKKEKAPDFGDASPCSRARLLV
jgi:hypothetical protein